MPLRVRRGAQLGSKLFWEWQAGAICCFFRQERIIPVNTWSIFRKEGLPLTWEEKLFTESDFQQFYSLIDDSCEARINSRPVRPDGQSFEEFMKKGSSALINNHASLVKQII